MSKEELAKQKELSKGFVKFKEEKVVTEETPYMYLSTIINDQLLKENKEGGGYIAHTIKLFTTDKKAFTVLLEKAGYTVKGLRATI
jgi:hypothetical protein